MTVELRDRGLTNEELRILVIGNSFHHTKNFLFLVQELIRLDPRVRATLVCCAVQYALFAQLVAGSAVELVPFEGEANANSASAPPQTLEVSVSQTGFLRAILAFKKSLARIPLAMPLLKKPVAAMNAAARDSTPGLVLRERALVARLRQEKLMADRLFDRVSPNVILAFGDRHPDIEAPILLVARDRGIRAVIPYTVYSGKDILIEVRKNDPDFQAVKPSSVYRWMKAAHFRHQLHEGLFYQPPSILAAYETFGALSSYPWCLGNGLSDIVCVDSEVTAQRYQNDRVRADKIRIIGDVVYDKVAEVFHRRHEIRAALMETYGFDNNRKLIVLALPQLAEQGVLDWESHWKEMRFLVQEVSLAKQNLLISLHPRMNAADYAFLEKEYSCRIAQERLSDFISAPDVFMANYSSTVVWAVLCGVKTVIVDFYGLNYRFFDYLTSLTIIRDRERLQPALSAAIHGGAADFSADWKALSRKDVLDGRTIQRYLDLFHELAKTPLVPAVHAAERQAAV